MFDYLKSAKKSDIGKVMKLEIAENVKVNIDKLKAIDLTQYSENELKNLCAQNYKNILGKTFVDMDASYKFLTDDTFVVVLSSVLYSVTLTDNERITLCNAIWNLRRRPEVSDYNKKLLSNLGKIANKELMPRLMELGFSEHLAGDIAINFNSSFQQMKRVSRVNRILLTINEDVYTDTIVKLYEILGYFSHFTDLFDGIMYDRMDVSNLTDHQKEIYATINVALLDIIEELPANLLYTLLLNFIDTSFMRTNFKIRFNLASCSASDYPRLNRIILSLQAQGKYIPCS